jgi:hypothetical protein
MGFLDSIFGSLQDVAQNALPDTQEIIDGALGGTNIDETIQGVVESPQDAIQNGISDIFNQQ